MRPLAVDPLLRPELQPATPVVAGEAEVCPQTHEEGFAEWLRERDLDSMVLTDKDFLRTHPCKAATSLGISPGQAAPPASPAPPIEEGPMGLCASAPLTTPQPRRPDHGVPSYEELLGELDAAALDEERAPSAPATAPVDRLPLWERTPPARPTAAPEWGPSTVEVEHRWKAEAAWRSGTFDFDLLDAKDTAERQATTVLEKPAVATAQARELLAEAGTGGPWPVPSDPEIGEAGTGGQVTISKAPPSEDERHMGELRNRCESLGIGTEWLGEAQLPGGPLRCVEALERLAAAPVKELRQRCLRLGLGIEGVVEKQDIVKRLQQVTLWEVLSPRHLEAEFRRFNVPKEDGPAFGQPFGGTLPGTSHLVTRLIAHVFPSTQRPPAAEVLQTGPKPVASPGHASATGQQTSLKAPPAPKAPAPAAAPAAGEAGRRAATTTGNSRTAAARLPRPKAQPHRGRGPDEDEGAARRNAATVGPRTKKALDEFHPMYSGDMPPPEAEDEWSEKDFYNFFYSSGFIKPPRKKNPKGKDVPKALLRVFYETLHLQPGAKVEQVRKAYRKLALKYHPDKNSDSRDSTEKFRDITEAYHGICQHLETVSTR